MSWEVVVSSAVSLVVGTLLGAWFNRFIQRSKLVVTGGGGGGGPGPGFHQSRVSISNRPGLLGIRLSETVLFGKTIHNRIEKGLSIDRNPANECRAQMLDKKSGQFITSLWWRSRGEPEILKPTVTIRSGETFDLFLFARLNTEPSRYFIFQPGEDGRTPKAPHDDAKFTDTREFIVRILYSYDRQRLTFPVTVRKNFDGRLYVDRAQGGGGSF
jgi:hypothetical protein